MKKKTVVGISPWKRSSSDQRSRTKEVVTGDLNTPSARVYEPPPEPDYPFHDKAVRVTHCGRICMGRRKINLSRVSAGELVGIREADDHGWLVSFLDFDFGFFDQHEGRVEPAQNPFGPGKVLTMSPE